MIRINTSGDKAKRGIMIGIFMFAFILPLVVSDEEVVFDYDPGLKGSKLAEESDNPASNENHGNMFVNVPVVSEEDISKEDQGDEDVAALTIVPEQSMRAIMTGIKVIENQTLEYVSHLIKENEELESQIQLLKGKIDEQNQIINKLLEEQAVKH